MNGERQTEAKRTACARVNGKRATSGLSVIVWILPQFRGSDSIPWQSRGWMTFRLQPKSLSGRKLLPPASLRSLTDVRQNGADRTVMTEAPRRRPARSAAVCQAHAIVPTSVR
jgi:hypothetical protein